MLPFDTFLIAAVIAAAVIWLGLLLFVLSVQRRRAAGRATIAAVISALGGDELARLPLKERVARSRPIVATATRAWITRAAIDASTPPAVAEVLAACLVERWGAEALERDAVSHRSARDKWRRMAAIRILFRLDPARALSLVARALDERDRDVTAVALSLLSESTDPAAGDLLVDALKGGHHPRSRVALYVDRSPQHLAARLRLLLTDADPLVREMAATLLGRYADVADLETALAAVADDPDPRVRKAAVQSLGQIGEAAAAVTALRLLGDPVAFVRAAAARAIGKLDRDDLASEVALLLGDRDWWVRFAVKESLLGMGPEIWPVLVRLLDDHDRYVRNGAAEVFQNLGVLDSFIVMEAATEDPAASKIDLLRRVAAAGGLRLTDSLLERAGATLGPRVRRLLADVGLEHLGVAS